LIASLSGLGGGLLVIAVPRRFNKNAPDVYLAATPTESGSSLLEYLCQRLAIPDLRQHEVLDFGCGCRFAEAIVNRQIPIKSYVGIDLDKEMIDFLSSNITEPRLSFVHFDARNPSYNPGGEPISADTALPIGDRKFDVICMFSVITHQLPADAEAIFAILRRHIKDDGPLFFSAALEPGEFGYAEKIPEHPTALSIYSPGMLRSLVERRGWEIVSLEGKNPDDLPILDSFVCIPRSPSA
jgi:SAM-dependent methyltransferase